MTIFAGPSWDASLWEPGLSKVGSSLQVVGDSLRIQTGTSTYGAAKISRKLISGPMSTTFHRVRWRWISGNEQYLQLWSRSDATVDKDGYALIFRPVDGFVEVVRTVNWSMVQVGKPYSGSMPVNTWFDAILSVSGGVVKAKIWQGTEPSIGGPDNDGYQTKFVDAAPLPSGEPGFGFQAGSPSAVCELSNSIFYVTNGERPDIQSAPVITEVSASPGTVVPPNTVVTLIGKPPGGVWSQTQGLSASLSAPVTDATNTRVTYTSTNPSTTNNADRTFQYNLSPSAPAVSTITVTEEA